MGDIISLHERRCEKYLDRSVEYNEILSEGFTDLVDKYDHRREDLWYIRLIVKQFMASVNYKLKEHHTTTPPGTLELDVSKEVSSTATPSRWSVCVGNKANPPIIEALRFTVKIIPISTMSQYKSKGYSSDYSTVWHEAYMKHLMLNDTHIHLGDDILFRAYEDANLVLMPGPFSRSTVTTEPVMYCFDYMGSAIKGDILTTVAVRMLPDDKVIIITSFYNTQAVRRHVNKVKHTT